MCHPTSASASSDDHPCAPRNSQQITATKNRSEREGIRSCAQRFWSTDSICFLPAFARAEGISGAVAPMVSWGIMPLCNTSPGRGDHFSRLLKNPLEDRFGPLIYIRGSVGSCFLIVAPPNHDGHRAGARVFQ